MAASQNPYQPKASQELKDKRKAHVYQTKANFDGKTFTISVYDAMTQAEFQTYYTQQHFPNHKILDIAKAVIDAVNAANQGGQNMVLIQEHNNVAFVSIHGSQIPTLGVPRKK